MSSASRRKTRSSGSIASPPGLRPMPKTARASRVPSMSRMRNTARNTRCGASCMANSLCARWRGGFFRNFDPERHIAKKRLAYYPDFPLILGIDQGGRPALIIMQPTARGQVRILDEVVTDSGPFHRQRAFATMCARPARKRLPGARIASAGADPAGFLGADSQNGEMAWAQTLQQALGIAIPTSLDAGNRCAPRVVRPRAADEYRRRNARIADFAAFEAAHPGFRLEICVEEGTDPARREIAAAQGRICRYTGRAAIRASHLARAARRALGGLHRGARRWRAAAGRAPRDEGQFPVLR